MGHRVAGIGLGLRWPLLEDILASPPIELAWLEIAPENYMGRGGRFRDALDRCASRFPIVTHGLALSLGGFDPLAVAYLRELRSVIAQTETPWHSDHLCFAVVDGIATHDLLPIPFNPAVAQHVADRIKRAQDILGLPLAIENISAYAVAPGSSMSEEEFLSEVLTRADCRLLLDVNNVFVNSKNHGFDARTMIAALPLERVCQLHVAGHETNESGRIDTHAEDICEEVYDLLEWTLTRTGPRPVLLERDDNFPEWDHLCGELRRLDLIAKRAAQRHASTKARAIVEAQP
jgi:uncharacterized protein (UPF0276 family)